MLVVNYVFNYLKDMVFKTPFDPEKAKLLLNECIKRLKILQKKIESKNNEAKKEISTYLEKGKVTNARIKIDHIIREDYNIESLEVLIMYCETMISNLGFITQSTELDRSIAKAVKTIAFAAPRYDIKELHEIHKELVNKYGMEINEVKNDNSENEIHPKIYNFFKNKDISETLANKYLTEIANIYHIDWECPPEEEKSKEKKEKINEKCCCSDSVHPKKNNNPQNAFEGEGSYSEIPPPPYSLIADDSDSKNDQMLVFPSAPAKLIDNTDSNMYPNNLINNNDSNEELEKSKCNMTQLFDDSDSNTYPNIHINNDDNNDTNDDTNDDTNGELEKRFEINRNE
jgi:vacuolar protein sorting-associated protein IST1